MKLKTSIAKYTIAILILLIAGIFLWGINTVASVALFSIALAGSLVLVWNVFIDRIETNTGFTQPIYREQNLSRRSLADIENRMKTTLEKIENAYSSYGSIFDDIDESELSENTMEDYDAEIPIGLIDGIQTEYCDRLENIGIMDIDELAIADPEEISDSAKVSRQTAEEWILDAKILFVGAQISSLIPLSMSDPKEIQKRIEKARKSGALKMPVDHDVSLSKIERWINRANEMVSSFDVAEIQKLLDDSDR
ncbi:MAG: hypothetical protein ACFFED_13090 [Candidatus Thorarchaeota archaeon]